MLEQNKENESRMVSDLTVVLTRLKYFHIHKLNYEKLPMFLCDADDLGLSIVA